MTQKNDKGPTIHDQTDIEVPSMEASQEEKSAFFEQWKAKHQAYLEHQKQTVISEEVPSIVQEKKKLFQGIKKPGKLSSVPKNQLEEKKNRQVEIPKKVIWKSVPILVVSLLLAALSLYFISPTSKAKNIVVKGQDKLTTEQVIKYSLISDKDYVVTTLLNASAYAENVKKNNPSVETSEISYQFPNQFTIRIKEYAIIGYIQQNDQLYPVLSSGNIGTEIVAVDTLPETYTTIQLSDKNQVKQLAIALGEIEPTIREKIQTVSLTPSQVTADLLTFNMTDGNTVLVPLSELTEKLAYYTKIAAEAEGPITIDMEVGIYRYSSEI
ncbi:TPA: cell division protein FtsQ/DivIB [Streptococcus suis]